MTFNLSVFITSAGKIHAMRSILTTHVERFLGLISEHFSARRTVSDRSNLTPSVVILRLVLVNRAFAYQTLVTSV